MNITKKDRIEAFEKMYGGPLIADLMDYPPENSEAYLLDKDGKSVYHTRFQFDEIGVPGYFGTRNGARQNPNEIMGYFSKERSALPPLRREYSLRETTPIESFSDQNIIQINFFAKRDDILLGLTRFLMTHETKPQFSVNNFAKAVGGAYGVHVSCFPNLYAYIIAYYGYHCFLNIDYPST